MSVCPCFDVFYLQITSEHIATIACVALSMRSNDDDDDDMDDDMDDDDEDDDEDNQRAAAV